MQAVTHSTVHAPPRQRGATATPDRGWVHFPPAAFSRGWVHFPPPGLAVPNDAVSALYVVRSSAIVKVGITNNPDRRLAQHAAQGLTHVVYILRDDPDLNDLGLINARIRGLENDWKRYVQRNQHLAVTRRELPDGYTEALHLTRDVRRYVDALVRRLPH